MKEKEYILWINLLQTITVKNYYDLYDYFDNMESLYQCSEDQLSACPVLDDKNIEEIKSSKCNLLLEQHLDTLKNKNIEYITIQDEQYPPILKNIHLPPPIIYYRGKISNSIFDNCISIVGSRNASYYGLKSSEKIALDLASKNITIVSGLARGIDSMAHVGALKAKGKTIAILGNGIDIIYPKENKYLYKQITEIGLIMSEFPPGTKPINYNFPRRNRIVSGLSLGTVIIEAACKSGSLITAKYALEQGREVYALPGNVNNTNSKGTNLLIKEGAKIITSCNDILEDIFPMFSASDRKKEVTDLTNLTNEEIQILKLIKMGYWDSDKLHQKLNLPIKSINYLLTTLEIKNKIVIYKGNYFVK
ncbi:DNA-protecting protein DprA [Alkalibaculum sp. M08DMB]|uniref:DNA-protecting protein DprA n=1 Tax=Alkalibaculum sporogenes TaxID=2655001 RepID=A0A6A7K9X8_9FIRM|nr:DNA-processing protein DprA [Alkalibaculum sporogenes]MPW25853.1 DNA-protecting protein DprA [Alkalibaculum sporogenes]